MITEDRIIHIRSGEAFDLEELCKTLEDLWKIARSAKRWIRASPGIAAVEAEALLVKDLEAIQGI